MGRRDVVAGGGWWGFVAASLSAAPGCLGRSEDGCGAGRPPLRSLSRWLGKSSVCGRGRWGRGVSHADREGWLLLARWIFLFVLVA